MLAYLRTALAACRLSRTEPSFLLHPLDLLGGDQVRELAFFPGMDLPGKRKIELFLKVLRVLGEHFRLVNMSQHAEAIVGRGRLPAVRCGASAPALESPDDHPAAPRRRARAASHLPPVADPPMCGIAGIIRFDGQPADTQTLLAMAARLGHRGPDGEGHLAQGPVGLAHKRLAIIDLVSGEQPMESGGSVIVFNGEIYNYIELREELISRGPPIPHDLRHRGHPAAVRGVRTRLRKPAQRDVRLRPVGPAARTGAGRARPLRHQAALPARHPRTPALRLRDQGAAGGSRGAGRAGRPGRAAVPDLPVRAGRRHDVPGRAQAASGRIPPGRPGHGQPPGGALLGAEVPGGHPARATPISRSGSPGSSRTRSGCSCAAMCRWAPT